METFLNGIGTAKIFPLGRVEWSGMGIFLRQFPPSKVSQVSHAMRPGDELIGCRVTLDLV